MKNWVRIAEGYDGGFTEFYFELYNDNNFFKLKETSYHYNANKETLLSEVDVPVKLMSVDEIIEFISKNVPKRYKIDINSLKENKELIDFIMSKL